MKVVGLNSEKNIALYIYTASSLQGLYALL